MCRWDSHLQGSCIDNWPIDRQVFGSSFNTNGLGGVLTCGVTGLKAGLSHAPQAAVSATRTCMHYRFSRHSCRPQHLSHISISSVSTRRKFNMRQQIFLHPRSLYRQLSAAQLTHFL